VEHTVHRLRLLEQALSSACLRVAGSITPRTFMRVHNPMSFTRADLTKLMARLAKHQPQLQLAA
jgi:hypothetical protein